MSKDHQPIWEDWGHPHTSSLHLDAAPEAIIVPTRDEACIRDPEEYMMRINQLQSPNERLFELTKSVFDLHEEPTHESSYIRYMAMTGIISGWFYGGFLKNTSATEDYVRKFNAATFEGKTSARKHFTDTYIAGTVGKGFKPAIYNGMLLGSAGFVAFGSITYRNRLYYPDWALGFITLGALSRFWSLGLRGAIAGGGFGLIGGTMGFGLAKFLELVSGKSISEIGFEHHLQYVRKREQMREAHQRAQESATKKYIARMGG